MNWARRDTRPGQGRKPRGRAAKHRRRTTATSAARSRLRSDTAATANASETFAALLREVARPLAGPLPVATLVEGTTLAGGRLRVGRCIGEGGMGAVYEVFDTERRARLALKTLLRLDGASVYRLKNEFRALSSVRHGNLVSLHELFGDGQRWFFTMELVRGERFDRFVRPQGALDGRRLCRAFAQLAAAVAAIHAAGKLHRDLKPSNVLVTRAGVVRVLDFGLASDALPGGIGQTLVDATLSGTPAYLAPELCAGGAASTASDVYALGVMLFEALTGVLPFAGSLQQLLADKRAQPAPAVRSLCENAPRALATLCDALLTRDPDRRPNAADLCTRLGVGARPPHARRRRTGGAPDLRRAGTRDPSASRADLATLQRAYAHSRVEGPTLVLLSGPQREATARMQRFTRELCEARPALLSGVCSARERVPLNGLDGWVDALSRHLRTLDAAEAAALMPRDVEALTRVFPVLSRVDAVAHAPRGRVRATDLEARALCALWELLARAADRRPLVLHVAQAQHMDVASRAALCGVLSQPDPPAALWVLQCGGGAWPPAFAALRDSARANPRVRIFEVRVSGTADCESNRDVV